MWFKRFLKNETGFFHPHVDLMALIFLIGIVSAIVIPIVTNYVRKHRVELVKFLIALLELRDEGTEEIRSCPVTGSPYAVVKTANEWTLRCPDHYEKYGSHPRLETRNESRVFTQDLPDVTAPTNGNWTLSLSFVLEVEDGRILIRDTSGTFQAIVQLYHPNGKIIFECHLDAAGTERAG